MSLSEKLGNLKSNELLKGSLILLILLNIGNVINYVFQFSMARMLGPIDYGVFAVLTNIVYIFSVPTLSIQTVVSKNTTKFAIKNEYGKIKGFFEDMVKKTLILSSICFVVFMIASIFLSSLLNISYLLLIFTGIFLFGAFVYPVAIGLFQGLKKFNSWGWNYIIACVVKLIFAVTLVYIGWRVYGAIIGFIVSVTIPFLIALPSIKKITHAEKIKENAQIFSKDSLSTFFAMLLIVFIYSIDVIFARIYFPAEIVGKYAVISMIGKIILFAATGIASAMFPISSEKFSSGKTTREIVKKAFIATILLCSAAIIIFIIFPDLVIRILFGGQYTTLTGVLVYIGVAFSFISFLNLLVLYKISNEKFKIKHIFILVLMLIIEISTFVLFHSTIEKFSLGFMISTIIMFIGGLILIRK